METYDELKAAIVKTANRSDGDFALQTPRFIRLAEARMRRDIRARGETQTLDITIEEDSYPLPCGFDGIVSINGRGAGNRSVNYVSSDTMDKTQYPAVNSYTISGEDIYFSRAPGDIRLRYRALFAPLSARQRCNWILSKHPDAYLYGALIDSAPYLEDDPRLSTWASLFNSAIEGINKQALAQQFGGPLLIQSDRVYDGYTRTRGVMIPEADNGGGGDDVGVYIEAPDFLAVFEEAEGG